MMMILLAVLGVMISVLSPVLGLMFIFPKTGSSEYSNSSKTGYFYLVWGFSSVVLYWTHTIDLVSFITINLNVALLSFICSQMLKKEMALEVIMTTALGISGLTGLIKFFFFRKSIEESINLSIKSMSDLIQNKYAPGTDEYQMITETINVSKELYLKYNYSFAVFTIMIALWIGFILLNKKLRTPYFLSQYSNLNYLLIPVIIGLGLIINKPTMVAGINLIIPCLALYFIQGLSVIWFFFGKMIANSKLLIVISIISLLINPYLIVMIAFAGFADHWADLRKLNKMEETHENNTH